MKVKIIIIMLIVLTASSAFGFDGMRKGFVLGGGLGFGPLARTSLGDFSEDESGFAINILIGYAWDEQNMIVYLEDGIVFDAGFVNILQGFSGASYYHYFKPEGPTFFLNGGIGLQNFMALESGYTNPDRGFGMLIGGGYEFSKHWQVYGSLSFGKTGSGIWETDHTQLMFTVSGVAF